MAITFNPGPVPVNASAEWDPDTQSWAVIDLDTNQVLQTGLTQQDAELLAQEFSTGTNDAATNALIAAAAEADAKVAANNQEVDDQDPFEAARLRAIEEEDTEPRVFTAEDLGVDELSDDEIAKLEAQQRANRDALRGEDQIEAQAVKAKLAEAQAQATIQQRFNQTTQGDWRVRIRLPPGATYLYNDPTNSLLAPLRANNGVIFPYTPTISTNFTATYDQYDLTHSNHRGYFYKNSKVGDITITGTFTAQDTAEAEYLLAVIVFFRSVTKMFYGKDPQRGAPPPIVELSGFGQYQFNNHPCLVSSFNYSLPNDVDYVSINPNNQGLNLSSRQTRSSSNPGSLEGIWERLKSIGSPRGAVASPGDLGAVGQTTSGTGQTTYVPTKMDITITLLPVQSREQVSKMFSVKEFSNGNLLKGGFW